MQNVDTDLCMAILSSEQALVCVLLRGGLPSARMAVGLGGCHPGIKL